MRSKIPTELYYQEHSVFRKRMFNKGTWNFELRIEIGNKLPSWVIVRFMGSDKFDEQTRSNSAFDWLPTSSTI